MSTAQSQWVINQLSKKIHGFFIDSGAGMGITSSNSYELEAKYQWSGICIEPTPEFFEDLVKTRHCHLVKAALSDAEGEATFVIPDSPWLAGLQDKLGDDIWSPSRAAATRKIKVETFKVGTLLKRFNAPPVIDYWSLDTEGSEFDILKTFPWDEYSVTLLTIEHNQDSPRQTAISKYLADLNYDEVQLTENEFGFVKRK